MGFTFYYHWIAPHAPIRFTHAPCPLPCMWPAFHACALFARVSSVHAPGLKNMPK